MSSELKAETSRINGAKSHGPVTLAGLENSSRNALKHGGAAARGVLLACESAEEFEELHASFLATYEPDGPAETTLVDQMAAARWRILRLDQIETGLLDDEMALQEAGLESIDRRPLLARAFRTLADESKALALAGRYQSRQHRIHDRAYKTLRELQQNRVEKEDQLPGRLEVSWVDPEEKLARENARDEAAERHRRIMEACPEATCPRSLAILRNEPAVAQNKEVSDTLPALDPALRPALDNDPCEGER